MKQFPPQTEMASSRPKTPHYTPLPPISSPTPTVKTDDDKSDDGLPDTIDEALPVLKRCIQRLDTHPELKEETSSSDLTNIYWACEIWARDATTVDRFCKKMVDMKFTELYQKLWKTNFTKVFPLMSLGQNEAQDMISQLHSAMWNLSDKSSDVCQRIMQVKLHSDILGYLKSETFNPSKLNDDKNSFAQGMIGILHNVVQRAPGAREAFRECDAVGILQTFRECDRMMLSTVALMIQAYLVTEAENEKLNSKIETFKFLVEMLNCSIKGQSYHAVNFAVIEVIEVINKLASNDSNKQRIVESGALPYYVMCMQEKFGVKVQREAAHGLWTLAFKCRAAIVKEPGCIDGLKVLLKHEDEKVKQKAEGALWILEEKDKDVTTVANTSNTKSKKAHNGHVFISYQWDAKPTVLKVRDKLKEAGFNVWIDEDDMSGSVLDAMANAVEQATVVVVCLSQKYKDSPSCRTEAEYTFRLRKKVIPLRLQPKYYPDGWLGIMIGSKLVFDVSVDTKVEESTKHLIKELAGQDEPDGPIKASVAPITYANPPSEGLPATSPVYSWTHDDIKKWMQKNNIAHLDQLFSKFTGPLLVEYNAMCLNAPEALYAYCLKKDVDLPDALALSKALKELN